MEKYGCKSKGSLHSERGLHPTFQNETPPHQVSGNPEQLCKPCEKPFFQGGIASSDRQVGIGKSGCPVFPSLLQPVISSTKAQQQMETDLRSQSAHPVSQSRYIQNENTGNNQIISANGEMGNISGPQRRVFPHTTKIKEISRVLLEQTYQFTAPPFGLATTPLEFTKVIKEVKVMAQIRGIRIHQYVDDWLLRTPCHETC